MGKASAGFQATVKDMAKLDEKDAKKKPAGALSKAAELAKKAADDKSKGKKPTINAAYIAHEKKVKAEVDEMLDGTASKAARAASHGKDMEKKSGFSVGKTLDKTEAEVAGLKKGTLKKPMAKRIEDKIHKLAEAAKEKREKKAGRFAGECDAYAVADCAMEPAALHCEVVSGKCVKKTPEERHTAAAGTAMEKKEAAVGDTAAAF